MYRYSNKSFLVPNDAACTAFPDSMSTGSSLTPLPHFHATVKITIRWILQLNRLIPFCFSLPSPFQLLRHPWASIRCPTNPSCRWRAPVFCSACSSLLCSAKDYLAEEANFFLLISAFSASIFSFSKRIWIILSASLKSKAAVFCSF